MKIVFFDFMNVPAYDCDTPYEKGMGGTQSALCYYAEELAKSHEVHVVLSSNCEEKKSREVYFHPSSYVNSGLVCDVLIWCSGISKNARVILTKYVKANLTICWIPHNTNEVAINDLSELIYDFDMFAFVSEWQRKKFVDVYGIDVLKTMIMLNGISPGFQGDFDITNKKPHFIYISQPDRGLSILADNWAKVVEKCPTAELHTYSSRKLYGGLDSEEMLVLFDKLRSLPNAFVHDPVGQSKLVDVCREASFFAYPTNFYETGCITLTEACAGGCLPIVSDLGALGTYFDNCLHYDSTIGDQFVERACEYMDMFENNKEKFYATSERIANYYQEERDYKKLAEFFVSEVDKHLVEKAHSVKCFKEAQKNFSDGKYHEARLQLDNMIPFFEHHSYIYSFYLWRGVCNFYQKAYHNAVIFFEKASKYGNDLQLCVNMILTYEALKDDDNVVKWCEKALEFKFDMKIIFKILNLVQKKPYFVRSKWGKYLLSLWNDDIHSNEWMSLFLSHGNMVASDYTLTMKHNEGVELLSNLITKGLAFLILNKMDIEDSSLMRKNIEKLFSNVFLNLNYYETKNSEYYRFIRWYMDAIPTLKHVKKPLFTKVNGCRKIRVGFLTGDLVYHPVSYILNGIVENFDKNKFEVHTFSTTEKKEDNSLQNKIRKYSDYFYDLNDKDSDQVAQTIIEKDIDVLIEMTGHTSNGSELTNVLRYKPARVVANYFAFPNSYGIAEVDYKIGDNIVFPKGLDKFYVEKFCKIENGFHTYKPILDVVVNKKEHSGIVFGCTNNPKKYRPEWIKCVSKILKEVEGSKLKMRYFNLDDPSIQEFYFKEFEKHGIERSRIDLGLGESLQSYFNSYADMDICLDPFPYNGGTINIEILYVGLPYITLLGNSYVSRVGASILTQIGHPELIAKSMDEYVKLTVDLANDKERLAKYKETLRADMEKSTLGDNKAFTRNFENGILWMLKDSKQILPTFSFPKVDDVIVHETVQAKEDDSIPKLVIAESF
jgi:predicted O-linked N-acetylglucosamine transferase (SPINDLY family)